MGERATVFRTLAEAGQREYIHNKVRYMRGSVLKKKLGNERTEVGLILPYTTRGESGDAWT